MAPLQDNLTKKVRENLAKRDVFLNDGQLSKLITDINTGVIKSPASVLSDSFQVGRPAKQKPSTTTDGSLFGSIGQGLGDFGGQLAWEFYESATAGLGSMAFAEGSEQMRKALGAEEEMWGDASAAQKVGGAIGGAAGFFLPIKWIGAGTRVAASAIQGTRAAVRTAQAGAVKAAVSHGVGAQAAKSAVKSAIDTKVKSAAISKVTGRQLKFPSFRKQIVGKAGIYETGDAIAIQTFENGLRTGTVQSLMKQASADGLAMNKGAATEIANVLITGIREGRHVNTFGQWAARGLTKKTGKEELSRIGGYIGKFVDNYINFGIYNTAHELSMAHKEGRGMQMGDAAFNTFMFAAVLPLIEAIPGGVTTPLHKVIRDYRKIASRKPNYGKMGKEEMRTYAQMIMRMDKDHSVKVVVGGIEKTLTKESLASGRIGKDTLLPWLESWYAKRFTDFRTMTRSEVFKDMYRSIPRLAVGSLFFSGAAPGLHAQDGSIQYSGGLLDPRFRAEADPVEVATHALIGAFFTKRRKPLDAEVTRKMKHYENNYQEQLELLRVMGSEPTHLKTLIDVMQHGENEGLWGAGLLRQPTMIRVKEIFDEYLQSTEFQGRKDTGVTHGEVNEQIITDAFKKYFQMKSAEAARSGIDNVDDFLPSYSDLQRLTAAERSNLSRELNEITVDVEKKQKVKDLGWEDTEIRADNEIAESNMRMLEETAMAFADAAGLKYRDQRDKKGGKILFQRISGSQGKDLGAFNEYHTLVEILKEVQRVEYMSTKEGADIANITTEMKGKAAEILEGLKQDTITSTLGKEVDMYIDPVDNRMIDGIYDHHRRQLYERVHNVVTNKREAIQERDKPLLELFEEIFGTTDRKVNDRIGDYKVVDKDGKLSEEDLFALQEAVDSAQVMALQGKRPLRRTSLTETVPVETAQRLLKVMKENGMIGSRVFEDTVTLRSEISKYLWQRGRGKLPADVAVMLDFLTVGDLQLFPRVTTDGGRQGIGIPNRRTFEKVLIEFDPALASSHEARAEYMAIYDKLLERLRVVDDLAVDMGEEALYPDGYLMDAGRKTSVPDIKEALRKVDKLLDYSLQIEEPLARLVDGLDTSKDATSLKTLNESLKNRFLGDSGEWSLSSMESSIHELTEMRNGGKFSEKGLKDLDKIIIELENAAAKVKAVDQGMDIIDAESRAEKVNSIMQRISGRFEDIRKRALSIQQNDIFQRTEAQKAIVQMLIDGGRAINRPQVSNMLGQLRAWLLDGINEPAQGGRTESQLLNDYVQQHGWKPLQEYLQTVRTVNQKLVNPSAQSRYNQKIAEEQESFLSRMAKANASVNPNSIATKYGGIMLERETGNFSPRLRERIVSAHLAFEKTGSDKLWTDVANEIIQDVKRNTDEQSRKEYETNKLSPESGETIDQSVKNYTNEVVHEFVRHELPKMLATIVNTHKPLVFRYDGTQNLLVQDVDAIRMRGSVEEFAAWLNPEGTQKITNIAYLSSEGIDSRGRLRHISEIFADPTLIENVETDFSFTAEMARDARRGAPDIDKVDVINRERSGDGRMRRLAVSQGDDILYDAITLAENHSMWATKVRDWYDTKRASLKTQELKNNFDTIFKGAVEKIEKDKQSQNRGEERVLMRSMYYDFINTKGFNDLIGSENPELMQQNAASVFKYAHLSEKRNATAFDPLVERLHEKLVNEHIGSDDPLSEAYEKARKKGYKFNISTVPDEIANHPLFGARNQILNQLSDAMKVAEGPLKEAYKEMMDQINSDQFVSLQENTSNMDGASYLGTDAAHIVFAFQGTSLEDGRGGVKPIIHHNSLENGTTLIGKTNFFYDPVIAKALDAKGIDMLMGESAAKSHTSKPIENMPFDKELNFMENVAKGIEGNYKQDNEFLIPHSDVSTAFAPKSLDRGRVVDAIHNWMSTGESKELIEYMHLENNIALIIQDANKLEGPARNAEIRKLFQIAEEEGAYKEYGTHSMLNKLVNWGMDSGDILIQKQILRMFNKQTIGKLSSAVSENAGTSVFTPNPDLALPVYKLMPTDLGGIKTGARGEELLSQVIGATKKRRQIKYGEILLPGEAGKRIEQQNSRDIPIIFSGMRGNGQDIIRIFNPSTGKAEYWDQTLTDIKKGSEPGRLAPALEALDTILSKNIRNLTADEISYLVQGNGAPFKDLPLKIIEMFKKEFEGKAESVYKMTQKNLKQHNAAVGHVSLRIPRQQMGDMVINRVKGYNKEPFTGNVVGVNSFDVLTKHQGDFDVDKLFWYGDAPHGVWDMATRTSGLTVEPQPYIKTEYRADIFENGLKMGKGAGTIGTDPMSALKGDNNRNKRLIGRIVRLNHSLTFMENIGVTFMEGKGLSQLHSLIGKYDPRSEGARQVLSQKLNNVASTVLDPHKGASRLAYATENEVLDYLLFDSWGTDNLKEDGLIGGEKYHNGVEAHAQDRGIFRKALKMEGPQQDVLRDIVRELVMTVARPQRLFSGVFDETGQRSPEYWELGNMHDEMLRLHTNPNEYLFNRLWKRYGYSGAEGKRHKEKQAALLDIFFRNDKKGTMRYRDIQSLRSDIYANKDITANIMPVVSFSKVVSGEAGFDQFMQSTPSTFALRGLSRENIFRKGNPYEGYNHHPYLKNVSTLNKTFRDNVALLRASRDPSEELSYEEMDNLFSNLTDQKFAGDGINGATIDKIMKRDMIHQIVQEDRQQIEGYMDYLFSERWVNQTRIDRLVDRYNNLKQMESFFGQKAIKDYKNDPLFEGVDTEKGEDRWAKINVMTERRGRRYTNEGKRNQVVYTIRNNYDKQTQEVVGSKWDKKTLEGLEDVADPFGVLYNPIVLSPGFSTYLKKGQKYVFLNNPIRKHSVSDYEVQDGIAALNAIETYNPESFRVPLEQSMTVQFYNDVDATYNAIKRITTQAFKGVMDTKIRANEIYNKSSLDINYWMRRIFVDYGSFGESGLENPDRIRDIYESLIQPEPVYGSVMLAGGQAYPVLRQNARVVNVINRWMIERGGSYEEAVRIFAKRKGVMLRRLRDRNSGIEIDDLSTNSREYTSMQGADFSELGEHSRMIYDIINDPLRRGSLGSFETSLDIIKPSHDVSRSNKNKVVIRMIDGNEQVMTRYGKQGFKREGGLNIQSGETDPFKKALRKAEQGNCFKG